MDKSSLEKQIKSLEKKIQSASLPQDLAEKVLEEISLAGSGSFANFESVSNYVNWIVSLPFDKTTEDVLDLKTAKEVLDKNHYGLENAKNRILEYLASLILNLKKGRGEGINAPILCLVGLVGTGKTTLASSIAQALGRKFERIPFGGMGDASFLRGTSRTLTDSKPGAVIKNIIDAQSKNPVILLDEIDRIEEASRSDVMGVLVELLDPTQNKKFTDLYIDYPFDLSQTLFIATANNTTHIATAVLDRLEIIQMPSYSDTEKTMIAKSYLFPKMRQQTGLSAEQISVDEAVWPTIIRPLGFDSGIRSLERSIEAICRKVARMVVEGKIQTVNITSENVKEFLTV